MTNEIAGSVGLYVKDNNQDVYLMPHNAVESTTETDIVGTLQGTLNVYVWSMDPVLRDYVFPVPEPPSSEGSHVLQSNL